MDENIKICYASVFDDIHRVVKVTKLLCEGRNVMQHTEYYQKNILHYTATFLRKNKL